MEAQHICCVTNQLAGRTKVNTTTPRIGQMTTVHGKPAVIVAVYRYGTIDVETASGDCYRVSGLPFINTESAR